MTTITTRTSKLPKQCTIDWFKTTILGKLGVTGNDIQVKIVELEDISGGYMSYMTKVTLEWSGSNTVEALPRSLMLKALTLEKVTEQMKKQGLDEETVEKMVTNFAEGSKNIHINECYMYNQFLNNAELKVKTPRCFAAVEGAGFGTDAFILMEDISAVSGNIPLHQGFNIEQVKQLIDAVAEIQVQSVKDTEWMSHVNPMKPKDFEEMTAHMGKFLEMAKQKHPKEFDGITNDQIAPFVSAKQWTELASEGYYEWPVLVHGDLWTNNVMFARRGDGQFTDELVALIDWQITHRGQPGEDISRIIAIHLDSDQRKAHEEDLLKYYYGQIEKGFEDAAPFPFSYVKDWYEKSMSIPAVVLLMLHAMLSVNFTDEQASRTAKRSSDLLRDVIGSYYKQLELID